MTLRTISTEYDLKQLLRLLGNKKRPFSVEITDGRRRSVSQNRLQRLWLAEAAEQLGDRTIEQLRGECKLMFGVPILREENARFRERYDAVVKPLSYVQKLALMMEPLDMPVSRLLTTPQMTEYLERIVQYFGEQGCVLTQPAAA